MAKVDDVAAAILEQTGKITTMKLQKLVYYCQAWHLVEFSTPLFSEDLLAYENGPVVESLYRQHRGRYRVDGWPSGRAEMLDQDARHIVEGVIDRYGALSAETLSNMTHRELPWRRARVGIGDGEPSREKISLELMANYFGRQVADVETAVSHATASASLEGVDLDEDWQNVLRKVAEGSMTGDEAVRLAIQQDRDRG